MRSSPAPVSWAISSVISGCLISLANGSLACQMLTICQTGRSCDARLARRNTGLVPFLDHPLQFGAQDIDLATVELPAALDESVTVELRDLLVGQHGGILPKCGADDPMAPAPPR
jgi:hypothetical protein